MELLRIKQISLHMLQKNVIKEYMHAFKNIEFAIYCSPQDDTNYKTFRLIEGDR